MCQEFTKTRFITVPIKETLDKGIPIGSGECKAVRLHLNTFRRNSILPVTGNAQETPFYVYYGDSQSQENELTAFCSVDTDIKTLSDWSPIIYCENLEEVFIRYGGQSTSAQWPITANVQVMILD